MGFTPTEKIWFNGKLVPWHDAKVHVLAHGLHYGTGVFEGMRSYLTADGAAVFRLDTHLERFFQSAAVYEIEIPYSMQQLADATLDVVRTNKLENAYLRPIAFFDASTLSVWTKECPVSVAIAGFPSGAYLAGGLDNGVRVTVSPVRKFPSNAMPATGKASWPGSVAISSASWKVPSAASRRPRARWTRPSNSQVDTAEPRSPAARHPARLAVKPRSASSSRPRSRSARASSSWPSEVSSQSLSVSSPSAWDASTVAPSASPCSHASQPRAMVIAARVLASRLAARPADGSNGSSAA